MWLPWSPPSAQTNSTAEIERPSTEELKTPQAEEAIEHLKDTLREPRQLSFRTYSLIGFGAFVIIFSAGWRAHRRWDSVYRWYFKRAKQNQEVPDSWIKEKRIIKGFVSGVSDGDGFKFIHTPGPFWRKPFDFRKLPVYRQKGGNQALSLRMAAIDAPEMASGGAKGQPFAIESQKWLSDQILHKTIYCQVLDRERYGRIIVLPFLPRKLQPWWMKGNHGINLSEEILRQGLAFVYESKDGKFPHPDGKEGYMMLMHEAQKAKVGMWKNGTSLETPAQYKKRIRQGTALETADDVLEEDEGEEEVSLFRRGLRTLRNMFKKR